MTIETANALIALIFFVILMALPAWFAIDAIVDTYRAVAEDCRAAKRATRTAR